LTSDSSTTSDSATTIICTPVGTPTLSTAFSSFGSMRMLRRKALSGASGLPRRCRRQPSHSVASTKASTLAQAPLATPSCGSPLAPDAEFIRHLRIDPKLLKAVLKVGVPTGVQMIVVALSEVVLLSLVNGYGSSATAAYGAVNQVVAYVQFPAISIAITASILGAQAIGAGRADRLGAIAKTALMMNVALTGGLVLLGYLFSRPLMGFFITSAPVIEVAQTLLHIMLWSLVIFGMASALSGIMRASGSVLVPTAISIVCLIGVEVPVAWFMSHRIGLNGIWYAYPVTFGAMLLLQTAYYRLVWRRKAIRRLV